MIVINSFTNKQKQHEDFETKKLGEILTVKYGKSQKEVEDDEGKFPILGTGGVIGKTNSYLFNKPSVLIGRKGTIDKPMYMDTPFWTVDTLFYTEIRPNYHPKWLYYKFCIIPWKRFNEATGVPSLNISTINNVKIDIPPYEEQQKIASILSTWDKAIELKEKLIEQKKEQKKGLMQKLLTGEVRLPGFNEKWEKVRLGNICSITTGKLDANAMKENGKYKFFTCAKEVYSIDEYAFDTEALLVSGNGANVGYIHYYNGKFNAYQRTYVLDQFSNNILFIKYLLDENLKRRIHKEKNAGNTPYITMGTLSDMYLSLPSQVEQYEIAKILEKSDYEIDLLEKDLEYVKNQKQGLMQLLLTGKVRVKV